MPALPPGPGPSLALAALLWGAHAWLATPPDVVSFVLLAAFSALPCLVCAVLGRGLGLRWRPGPRVQLAVAIGAVLALLGLGGLAEQQGAAAAADGAVVVLPLALRVVAPCVACGALTTVLAAREPRP